MLEPPALSAESIAACLQSNYAVSVRRVDFLPLGADPNAAVYRVVTHEGAPYFLKLKRGPMNPLTLHFPAWLRDRGVAQVIVPLRTVTRTLHTGLQAFTAVLYPFVEGRNSYEVALTEAQWSSLGAVVRRLHTTELPTDFRRALPRESFSAEWGEKVRHFLVYIEQERLEEPTARETAAFIHSQRESIERLVNRADELARVLGVRALDFVACHGDLHAGNLHIASGDTWYLVDWDTLSLAPKERDLMFIGGGLLGGQRKPGEEERLFYGGYGATDSDSDAVAYYRYERIVQDIAVFCEGLLGSTEGGEDRRPSLAYLKSNFVPGGTLEQANRADGLR